MYHRLWDESPMVQKMKAESEAEGELQAAQRLIITIISTRFPGLAELAQQRIVQIHDTSILGGLAQQLVMASDENVARWMLDSTTTQ